MVPVPVARAIETPAGAPEIVTVNDLSGPDVECGHTGIERFTTVRALAELQRTAERAAEVAAHPPASN